MQLKVLEIIQKYVYQSLLKLLPLRMLRVTGASLSYWGRLALRFQNELRMFRLFSKTLLMEHI